MKLHLRLLFILTTLSFYSYAQVKPACSIRGKIIDLAAALPVPAAVLSLYAADSELVLLTTVSDEQGNFRFQALKPGVYKLRVSYVGFSPLFVKGIILGEKSLEKDLGALKISADQNSLAEVSITAVKPVVEMTADMITYNVNQSILGEGSTATDILKNVPMVQVDIDGNATIAGKRSTRVFIDGKPSDYMTSNIADLLNVLPSDAIEKIEVMTNPPVKYSADGEGILNIVLKKGFKIGFNGNAGITTGLQGNTNTNTNASYKAKSYSINGSAAYRTGIYKSSGQSFRENYFPDTTFYYDQHNQGRSRSSGGNFRSGLNWDIDTKQNLRVSVSYNKNNNKGNSGTIFNYLDQYKNLSRIRDQQNENQGSNYNLFFNTDYELKIDSNGQKLSVGLSLSRNASKDFRLLDRKYIFPQYANPVLQENNNNIGNKVLNLNLDYDKPLFNKRDQLELGIQYNYRKNDNDLLVQNFDFQQQQYLINMALTSRFLYTEHILGGYASYSYKKNGWGIKTGIRSELTSVNFDLSTGGSYALKPYLSLFPNFSVSRFFRKRYTIGASYSMRINRPRENSLNPQINNNDPLNIYFGNPGLSPSYTHQMDISFGVFGEKWSFTPRLSYSTARGVIERYRTVAPNGVSQSTYDNVGTNNSLALFLTGNYRPGKKVSLNTNMSVIRSDYTSLLNSTLNRNGFSFRAAGGLSLQLPFKTAFESNLTYSSNLNAQGRTQGSLNTSFAARKLFFDNRLNIRISGTDPFGRRNNTLYNEGANFRLNSYSSSNTSNLSLSINYRFTKVRKNPAPPATSVK